MMHANARETATKPNVA